MTNTEVGGFIADEELLRRAVLAARSRERGAKLVHTRWVAVQSVFGIGRSEARHLCERFDVNPDQLIQT